MNEQETQESQAKAVEFTAKTFSGDSVNVSYNYVLDNAGAESPYSGSFTIGCAVFEFIT